ncbi:hypothetical protein BUCNMO_215 [Buchnera aphidicola (Nipponaphis monzeni)]|uniref:UPF0259 membrane protein BUCNMO_215 n=1 Tax=Buchnera aphidicola (Nipponaphis monzeni) TaxID=2495405 RepID=A0A455TA56_9GAMM|nr:YciC family protein [Buchnera aphidicola]BBI01227.1 hypothetical protein BUCNMO_215 [Buchnera aphidicola (Nipponaphis monzeni)]
MSIVGNSLYHDTFHFFYKKLKFIFLISLCTACITSYIDYLIIPDISNIYHICTNKYLHSHSFVGLIKEMNQQQQKILFKYSIIRSVSSLIGNALLAYSTITFVHIICTNKSFDYFLLAQDCISIFPNLFLLILLITCIIQLGFMLLIIPGILFCILCALSPIILITEKKNILQSLQNSIIITTNAIKMLISPIIIWLFFKFILLIIHSIFTFIPENILMLTLNVIINLITSILIIYLCRFYMLLPTFKII